MKCRIKKMPQGGSLYGNSGLQLLGEGSIEQIGSNPYSGDIIEFKGKPHSKGGIDIQYAGTQAEVEGQETAFKDQNGDMQILGNLTIPNSNIKFKSAFKKIAKQEQKATKLQEKSSKLLDESNPFNPYSGLAFNSGKALQDAAMQKHLKLSQEKEGLAELQTSMLDLAEASGVKPEKLGDIMKYGGKLKAKNGLSLYKDIDKTKYPYNPLPGDIRREVEATAEKYGIDQNILSNLIMQESGGRPGLTSPKGAIGITQMLPDTAKQYGISEKELRSNRREDIAKVIDAGGQHFAKLLQSNNNDYTLALAAYNGGQGAVNFVKKETGNQNITGDDWLSFMEQRQQTAPTQKKSAWQNETFNYVKNISKGLTPLRGDGIMQNAQGQNEQLPILPLGSEQEMSQLNAQFPNRGTQPAPTNYGVTDVPSTYSNWQASSDISKQESQKAPQVQQKQKSLADRNRLGVTDFLSEIPAIFDRPDFVQGQTFEPQLFQPYSVSYQDRLNENNATFRALGRQVQNNPSALATLAGQKYQADNQVLAEQFRTNQGIQNETANKNVSLLNDAELKNLQLADQQYTRQAQAQANTDARREQALASISSKIGQNRRDNSTIRLMENMFNYRPDENMRLEYTGPNAQFNTFGSLGNPNKVVTRRDAIGNVLNTTETNPSDIQEMNDYLEYRKNKKAASGLTSRKWGGII